MPYYEYAGNLHVHTSYSDGEGSHQQIAEAALLAGLDFVVFTDHNVRVAGIEGYYGDDERGYVLLLSGEEVHDRTRNPQCNHVLVLGVESEVSPCAHSLPALLQEVDRQGGLSFIAHPDDQAVAWLGEPAIPWADRYVDGFTGLEVWNYMSCFKQHLPDRRQALRNMFRPEAVIVGPPPATLALWDELLAQGRQVVGIGAADAHGTRVRLGMMHHEVFPYDFLFSAVNTHVLTKAPLSGEVEYDKAQLYQALKAGRAFIGYDIPGETRGFRFSAQGQNTNAIMGETIRLGHGVTLQAMAPARARIRLICGGEIVAEEKHAENLTHVVRTPGAYRVEVWRRYQGVERAWILSNPIYVEPNPGSLRG
jgi:hypothetical protein